MLHCFQLVNTSAPGILSCLITTTARLVCLLNARVAPAAQDNFTGDISASFISELPVLHSLVYVINIDLLGEMIAGVQSTEEGEYSFVTYPVLLLVAHSPTACLRGSACSLLLLSCHGDLPLDGLV